MVFLPKMKGKKKKKLPPWAKNKRREREADYV
jgi:ribosomal protein S30